MSLCIFILIVLFEIIFATSQNDFFSNSTVRTRMLPSNEAEIKLDELASRIKVLLTEQQIISLVQKIIPGDFELVSKSSKDDFLKVSENELKETYKGLISQNLTEEPIYRLLHVPELLSNATHLRKIRNTIRSPRPVRPRKQVKGRSPSNIPGASPYFVHERMLEAYNFESDVQTDE
ncbi:uncharacterized protein ELE39_001757 [Cryptosporidium sp. chipmunk genotype I]|uniref:uncharacterized protein n=1 Tax=Cryptosporidium sp. chipmunk genotype I TaxID=1280935 RepID=UPI00351A3DE1|nr:hypothetical protein ELE39_001757 [Cryptosporidium sp. chipmunk genotype I]